MLCEPDMRVTYRYLTQDRDRHGNVRIYFRRDAIKVRVRETPGTPEFAERYRELARLGEAGELPRVEPKDATGTLAWLARLYESSAAFLNDLDPTTQRTRRGIIGHILEEPVFQGSEERFKDFPLTRMRLSALEVLRDRKRDKPEAANNRVRVLRAMFKWGLGKRHIAFNPATGLTKISTSSAGFHTWTVEEIAAFEARHPLGTKANLALRLMLYTGARRSDAPRLGRQNMRGGTLAWTAHKNRNRHPVAIDVPVLEPLAEALRATPTGDLIFLLTEYGKPFTTPGFGNWFRDRCDEAGLRHCSAHGLRKAGSTMAAEAGATAHQLMSMFGWRTLSEAERYTKAAERKRMAAAGMGLIVAGITARTKSSQTVPPRSEGGTNR